jgi:hypothetical protein
MTNATFIAIVGNPPADGAQPSGMKGMIVVVMIKVAHEPRSPSTPAFLFQNPKDKRAPNNHSETPKNQLAPRIPKTEYNQNITGPLLIKGISASASYSNHF